MSHGDAAGVVAASQAHAAYSQGEFERSLALLRSLDSSYRHRVHVQHNEHLAEYASASSPDTDAAIKSLLAVEEDSMRQHSNCTTDEGASYFLYTALFCSYNRAVLLYENRNFREAKMVLEEMMKRWKEGGIANEERADLLVRSSCFTLLDVYVMLSIREEASIDPRANEVVAYLEQRYQGALKEVAKAARSAASGTSSASGGGSGSSTSSAQSGSVSAMHGVAYLLHEYKVKTQLHTRMQRSSKKEMRNAMSISQQNAAAVLLKANLEFSRNNYNKGVELMEHAALRLLEALKAEEAENDPLMCLTCYNNLACINVRMHKYYAAAFYAATALQQCQRLYSASPSFALRSRNRCSDVWYNTAIAHLVTGRAETAFKCLLECVGEFLANPMLWLRLGECVVAMQVKQCNTCEDDGPLGREPLTAPVGQAEHQLARPTIEFGIVCMRNCLLLCNKAMERSVHSGAGPHPLVREHALLNLSFLGLCAQDPQLVISSCNDLRAMKGLSKCHSALSHIYLAEGLCMVGKAEEAARALHAGVLQEGNALTMPSSAIANPYGPSQEGLMPYTLLHNTVLCHISAGRVPEAMHVMQKAVDVCPPSCESKLVALVAFVHVKSGDVAQAERVLRQGRRAMRSDAVAP